MHTDMIVSDPTESFYSLLERCIGVLASAFKLKKDQESSIVGTEHLRPHWKSGIQNQIIKDFKKWKQRNIIRRDISDSALFLSS